MRAYERLLKYAAINTQSDENSGSVPSTECQRELAELLADEMRRMGMERVRVDEHAYTCGFISPTPGREQEPVIGLIAHLDTAPDFSGEKVRPRLIVDYDGGDVSLGESGRILKTADFPALKAMEGQALIVTDGTSLLGADDKAGIAEILTACEIILTDRLPHGGIAVCFVPDEEIGHGAELLDIESFGAKFAYTVDGDAVNEINCETFNAASAVFDIKGVNVHPGSAKGIMVNASLLAMEINALLPEEEIPAETEGYEGFYHLTEMSGSVEHAVLKYIVRDHDGEKFRQRCDKLREIEKAVNRRYAGEYVSLSLHPQYRNMKEVISENPEIVERAEKAIRKAGLTPKLVPVRGGTDGAQLSFRGLPCPNLGTGGEGFHGPYEHITAEAMDNAVDIILNIVSC